MLPVEISTDNIKGWESYLSGLFWFFYFGHIIFIHRLIWGYTYGIHLFSGIHSYYTSVFDVIYGFVLLINIIWYELFAANYFHHIVIIYIVFWCKLSKSTKLWQRWCITSNKLVCISILLPFTDNLWVVLFADNFYQSFLNSIVFWCNIYQSWINYIGFWCISANSINYIDFRCNTFIMTKSCHMR